MKKAIEKSSEKTTMRSRLLKYGAYAAALLSTVTLGLLSVKRYRKNSESDE